MFTSCHDKHAIIAGNVSCIKKKEWKTKNNEEVNMKTKQQTIKNLLSYFAAETCPVFSLTHLIYPAKVWLLLTRWEINMTSRQQKQLTVQHSFLLKEL